MAVNPCYCIMDIENILILDDNLVSVNNRHSCFDDKGQKSIRQPSVDFCTNFKTSQRPIMVEQPTRQWVKTSYAILCISLLCFLHEISQFLSF
jgi:hypothetical protein